MEKFESFVNNVLLRTDPATLHKFFLHSYRLSASRRLKTWLSSAVMRDVHEFELNIANQQPLELLESIYSCSSLEVLKLDSDFDINVPAFGMCFPNVKFLRVSLQLPENHLTEKLFCSYPSLQELWINVYLTNDGPATNIIISSTTLRRLYWTVLVDDYQFAFNNYDHKCVIFAPVLKLLHIVDDLVVSYEVHDLQSLQTMKLAIVFSEWLLVNPNRAVQILIGVLNCKYLTLSSGVSLRVIKLSLDRANISFLPSVPQLTHLEVKVGETGWRVLPLILTSSPQLQTFVLDKECWFDVCDAQFGWMENGSVPHFLAAHVKDIKIKGVEDQEDNVKLVEYFSKHCLVLEKMTIRCKGTVSKKQVNHLHHKLSHLHRGSAKCEIMLG